MTTPTAAGYVRELSFAMQERYSGDCVAHATRIAALLLAERRAPWIGRIRHVEPHGDSTFHFPLIPTRYAGMGGPAWTTHYIACSGREVYDPLAGEPVDVETYAATVFGESLTVQVHLDSAETERLVISGELRKRC
jgi:hypothetical protein